MTFLDSWFPNIATTLGGLLVGYLLGKKQKKSAERAARMLTSIATAAEERGELSLVRDQDGNPTGSRDIRIAPADAKLNTESQPPGPHLAAGESQMRGTGAVIPYPCRITTFIDLLGWTSDVKALEAGHPIFAPMEGVLSRIAKCKADIDRVRNAGRGRHDARMIAFSDCLLLSYDEGPGAAARALADAAFLGHVMLRGGFLPRGAITLGPLYHTDTAAFGGAFLKAYELERADAINPRILISNDVMELARQCPEFQENSHTRTDDDGQRYVHVLSMNWPFLSKEQAEERAGRYEGSGMSNLFDELRRMLPIRFARATTAEQRRKIEWMRDYVNISIENQALDEQKVALPK